MQRKHYNEIFEMKLGINERNDLLHDIYYGEYGFMNARELHKQAVEKKGKDAVTYDEVREWLSQQKVFQEYKNQLKYKGPEPHFNVDVPNDTHQADVMYLPKDYGFQYVLNVIDVATRFKASHALRNITGSAVRNAFIHIYKTTLLDYPKKLMIDGGKEYNEAVRELFEPETKVLIALPHNHKDQAFVERYNKTLAERLFKRMSHIEDENVKKAEKDIRIRDIGVNYKKKTEAKLSNSSWYKNLQKVVDQLNSERTRMIGMSPNDAMKQQHVRQPLDLDSPPDVIKYKVGDVVKYFLFGDQTVDKRRRATDRKWSFNNYVIKRIDKQEHRPIFYYIGPENDNLEDIITQGFKHNELQKVK